MQEIIAETFQDYIPSKNTLAQHLLTSIDFNLAEIKQPIFASMLIDLHSKLEQQKQSLREVLDGYDYSYKEINITQLYYFSYAQR